MREAMGRTVRGSARGGRFLLGAPRVLARRLTSALVSRLAPRHHAAQTRTLRRRAYPGSRRRRYEIHRPRGYTGLAALPLVMLLHGCRQTSADIRAISRLDALADRSQFVAVYPHVTGYSDLRMENCWGWWREEDIRAGAGEVEDLAQIVADVSGEVAVDPRRIHVAGLSSGGAMAVAALVAHPSLFASGAAIAGLPYSESARAVGAVNGGRPSFKGIDEIAAAMDGAMREAKREIPILVVHSHDDPVVDVQAARNIRDSWRRCFGIETALSTRRGRTRGTAWVRERYRGRSRRTAVEALFLEGPGHGWYGGAPGEFSYPNAPDVSRLMWAFFKAHARERGARGAVAAEAGMAQPTHIRISSRDART